ncbi:MAG: TonB-dependent receptor [Prevotella sp.]|nr:TonB-dependent receptor [Prevotella sp.]
MQKKLRLIVTALFIAQTALAQTDNTKQQDEQKAVIDEQTFTFTEAQLGEDDDMSQNVTIVSSNQNIYASQVGYTFSPVRFRYRAFNQKYNEIYINGAPMNDMESGQFRYSLVGGLNQQTRGVENALPFEFNNFSMSAMGGSNNYDFRPSHMPTGQRVTVSGANRNYTLRGMYTYNSGLTPSGWALSANVTYRWANMETSYIEGTFYNSLSYFLGAEKKLGDNHSISLVTWGNPTERSTQGAATDESYWLANSNYYNPYWGYQDGKKRNSRVVNDFAPTAMLTWDWQMGQNTRLTTTLTGRYSWYKSTKLNYNNSENPQPDYWKNMPSSYYDVWYTDDVAGRTESGYNDFFRARTFMMGSRAARQIDWDRLYYANQHHDGDAIYYVQAKHNDNLNLAFSTTLNTKLSQTTDWNIGLQLAANKGMHYQTMDDLLGAKTFHNINTYALGNYTMDDPQVYYDMRNKTGEVKEGDKFGYDYDLHVRKAQLWQSLKFAGENYTAFVAGRVGGVTMQRDGKMENGIAVAQGNGVTSYGKSETAKFLDGGAKMGVTSTTLRSAGLSWNAGLGFEYRAPQASTAFVSPEVNNDFVNNLKNEKVFTAEAGLQYENSWLKANVSGYFSHLNDVTEWQCFYDDDANSFTYVSMTGVQKEYYGLEWGLNLKVNSAFSIKTLGTISEAKNVNNANAIYMKSTEGTYHSDIVYNKNMREGGTPLSAYNLTLSYHSGGWFIDVMGNYYDRIYLYYSPSYRYGSTLDNRQKSYENSGISAEKVYEINEAGDKVLLSEAIDQQKGKGGFMLDLSIGKSIWLKKGSLSINLMVTNVLNNTKIVTGGYEQSRSNYSVNSTTDEVGNARTYKFDRNPKKYYAYGVNGMLNIAYKF